MDFETLSTTSQLGTPSSSTEFHSSHQHVCNTAKMGAIRNLWRLSSSVNFQERSFYYWEYLTANPSTPRHPNFSDLYFAGMNFEKTVLRLVAYCKWNFYFHSLIWLGISDRSETGYHFVWTFTGMICTSSEYVQKRQYSRTQSETSSDSQSKMNHWSSSDSIGDSDIPPLQFDIELNCYLWMVVFDLKLIFSVLRSISDNFQSQWATSKLVELQIHHWIVLIDVYCLQPLSSAR